MANEDPVASDRSEPRENTMPAVGIPPDLRVTFPLRGLAAIVGAMLADMHAQVRGEILAAIAEHEARYHGGGAGGDHAAA
jgi:hypothetical protein